MVSLLETNISPLEIGHSKRKHQETIVFQPSIFSGELLVSGSVLLTPVLNLIVCHRSFFGEVTQKTPYLPCVSVLKKDTLIIWEYDDWCMPSLEWFLQVKVPKGASKLPRWSWHQVELLNWIPRAPPFPMYSLKLDSHARRAPTSYKWSGLTPINGLKWPYMALYMGHWCYTPYKWSGGSPFIAGMGPLYVPTIPTPSTWRIIPVSK